MVAVAVRLRRTERTGPQEQREACERKPKMAQFENKIVVVTGGTQGLGAATATLLAQRGAKGLVICGRSEEKGKAQAARLAALGTETVFVKADLSNVDNCKAVIAAADKSFGRLDSL